MCWYHTLGDRHGFTPAPMFARDSFSIEFHENKNSRAEKWNYAICRSVHLLLIPRQRSLFLQEMAINPETHNWGTFREWEHLVLNECVYRHLPTRLRGYMERRWEGGKICRWGWCQRSGAFRRTRGDPHMNSEGLWQHTQHRHRLKPDKVPARRAGSG